MSMATPRDFAVHFGLTKTRLPNSAVFLSLGLIAREYFDKRACRRAEQSSPDCSAVWCSQNAIPQTRAYVPYEYSQAVMLDGIRYRSIHMLVTETIPNYQQACVSGRKYAFENVEVPREQRRRRNLLCLCRSDDHRALWTGCPPVE